MPVTPIPGSTTENVSRHCVPGGSKSPLVENHHFLEPPSQFPWPVVVQILLCRGSSYFHPPQHTHMCAQTCTHTHTHMLQNDAVYSRVWGQPRRFSSSQNQLTARVMLENPWAWVQVSVEASALIPCPEGSPLGAQRLRCLSTLSGCQMGAPRQLLAKSWSL